MKNCQAIARSEFGKVKELEMVCGDGKSWVLVGGVALCSDKMQQVMNCSSGKIQIWTVWATYKLFYWPNVGSESALSEMCANIQNLMEPTFLHSDFLC